MKLSFRPPLIHQLEENGFVVLRGAAQPSLLVELLEEMIASPKVWDKHQEVPLESLQVSSRLSNLAIQLRDSIHVSIEKILVPSHWTETLYLRRKQLSHFTKNHQDFDFFFTRGYVKSKEDPADTWWMQVSDVEEGSSRLELSLGQSQSAFVPSLAEGDLLIFHQTAWHRATTHNSKNPRFSLDGRFLLQ